MFNMLYKIFYFTTWVPIIICLPSALYGPFDLRITSFLVCHGPKAKDCAVWHSRVIGHTKLLINVTVTKTCSPAKGKIIPSANGKDLARLQMNKPCDHIFLRPIFESLYKATKKCEILKGEYQNEVDIGQYIINYFGGSFFYGNVSFKTFLYNNECNFVCSIIDVELTPKK